MTMNRTQRRKAERTAARNQKLAKIGAMVMIAGLSSGIATSAYAAYDPSSDKVSIEKDSKGKNYLGLTTENDQIGMTAAMKQKLSEATKLTESPVRGTVKMSIPADAMNQLEAMGIKVDLDASEIASNKSIAGAKHAGDQGQMILVVDVIDKKKLQQHTKALGIKSKAFNVNEGERVSLNLIRSDNTETFAQYTNIASEETFKPKSVKAGDDVYLDAAGLEISFRDHTTFNKKLGGYYFGTAFPVSSLIDGGGVDKGKTKSDVMNTTLYNYYADADNPKHLSDLAKSGNTHKGAISNCVISTSECGFWITPTMNGQDDDDEGFNKALMDTFKLSVTSTATAGNIAELPTIDSPLVSPTGGKVWFEMLDAKKSPYYGNGETGFYASGNVPWSGVIYPSQSVFTLK